MSVLNDDHHDGPRPEAFADGELSAEQSEQVLERMAADAGVTRQVLHQQQLREAVARSFEQLAAPTPAGLRAKIEARLREQDRSEPARRPDVIGRVGW